MAQRVLITGGSGLLALNWAIAMRNTHDCVLGLHHRKVAMTGVRTEPIDLESLGVLRETLRRLKPDLVVHTTGLTSIEKCEINPRLALHVNATLAGNIATACAGESIKLVHISTDHLFTGHEAFVTELQPVDPINQYAASKAQGEREVVSTNPDSLVVRTNFFGWGTTYRQSFSDMIIKNLRLGKKLTLFHDVYYTPILAEFVARTVHELVSVDAKGVVNVVGGQRMSKYEFGIRLAECFGLDGQLIVRGVLADKPELVQRPQEMSLSNQKAQVLIGHQVASIDEQINRLMAQEKLGLTQEIQKL
jgi:dTDP-4-dehydrorhamnose reductase